MFDKHSNYFVVELNVLKFTMYEDIIRVYCAYIAFKLRIGIRNLRFQKRYTIRIIDDHQLLYSNMHNDMYINTCM